MSCRFLLQGNLPDPGIELRSPALQADSLLTEPRVRETYKAVLIFPNAVMCFRGKAHPLVFLVVLFCCAMQVAGYPRVGCPGTL